MKEILLSIIVVFSVAICTAQEDSVWVKKNFKFEDGVYLTYSSFKENRPDYSWEDVRSNLYSNPQTYMAQVEFIEVLDEEKTALNLDSIWGISIAGIPYIKLEKESIAKPNTNFAAIRLRGKICYYSYEDFEKKTVTIKAYNPVNGQPFRKGEVETKEKVKYEKMIWFDDGRMEDFNKTKLLEWIADDSSLYETVSLLTKEEAKEKLFKALLIYDDRNPVFIHTIKEEKN